MSREEADLEFTNKTFVRNMIDEITEKIGPAGGGADYTFHTIQPFIDSYYSINFHNVSHSPVMSQDFVRQMKNYFKHEHFYKIFRKPEATRISNHNLFNFLIHLIGNRIGYDTEDIPVTNVTKSIPMGAKYYALSGHDTTLTSLLSGLGHKEVDFPSYSSSFVIELHFDHTNHEFYLKFVYNDEVMNLRNQCNHNKECSPRLVLDYLKQQLLDVSYQEA